MVSPTERRRAVRAVAMQHQASERRVCRALGVHRSLVRYASRRRELEGLSEALEKHACDRPRFGYRRLTVMLRREGFAVNHKRVYRLYRAAGLAVRRRKRRRIALGRVRPAACPARPNERWSADFMHDALADGRRLRLFNVVDDATREGLAVEVASGFSGACVARALDRIAEQRGYPKALLLDNGPEFTSGVLEQWAYDRGVQLHFTRPGTPSDNAFIESFNGRVRDECLNQHWFRTLPDARQICAEWLHDYNHVRPHSALGLIPPKEYLSRLGL